jgi:hypothetical protein
LRPGFQNHHRAILHTRLPIQPARPRVRSEDEHRSGVFIAIEESDMGQDQVENKEQLGEEEAKEKPGRFQERPGDDFASAGDAEQQTEDEPPAPPSSVITPP